MAQVTGRPSQAAQASKGQAQSGHGGLRHHLTMMDYFALGFGAIIGTGWVVLVGDWMIVGGGPVPAILAFLLGALLLVPFGLVFGELASAIPVSGGVVDYAERAFGRPAAFLTGWFVILGNGCLVPWEGVAIAQFLAQVWGPIPGFGWMTGWRVHLGSSSVQVLPALLADAAAVLVIVLNHFGTRSMAAISRVLTAALTACVLVIFVVALVRSHGDWSGLVHPLFRSIDAGHSGSVSGAVTQVTGFGGGIAAVLVLTPFFYVGFDTIPQAAEEAGNSVDWKRFGWVITGSILAAAVFYAVCIAGFGLSGRWTDFVSKPFPAMLVIRGFPQWLVIPLFLIATISPLGPLNSFYAATSRVIFEMGRRRLVSPTFAYLDGQTGAPTHANAVLAVAALLGPWIPGYFLESLVSVSSLAFVLSCTISALACLRLRSTEPDLPRPARVPGGRLGILAAVAMGAILLALLVVPSSPGYLKGIEWGIVLVWTLAGLAVLAAEKLFGSERGSGGGESDGTARNR